MSGQKAVNFTKSNNGEMYYVKEVDAYVGMLTGAYSELLEEVESLEKAAKTSNPGGGLTESQKVEMENLKRQQAMVQRLLEQEREERKRVDQERLEFQQKATANIKLVTELQQKLDQSDAEKVKGLEQAKIFYEEQIKKLTENLEKEKENSQGLVDEKASWVEGHEQREQEKAALEEQIKEIRKKDADNLQFIIELQKEAEKIDSERTAELEQIKASYEEQLKTLSENLEGEKASSQKLTEEKEALIEQHAESIGTLKEQHAESIGTLREEHEESIGTLKEQHEESIGTLKEQYEESIGTLKEQHAENLKDYVVTQEELRKKIADFEKEVEVLNFQNSSKARSEACAALFEKIADSAESYTKNLEEHIEKTRAEAEESAAEHLKKSQVQAFNIIRNAKVEAQKIAEEAEAKVSCLLDSSKEEYAGLRKLIDKSSQEYAKLTSSIGEIELKEGMDNFR